MKIQNSNRTAEKFLDRDFHNTVGPSVYDLNRLQFQNFGGYNNAITPPGGGSAPVSKMRQVNRTLVFVIVNSSSTTQTVTLFNVAYGGTSPTFADNVSVAASMGRATYTSILNSIQASNAFKIAGMKYLARQNAQFANTFTIGTRDFTGQGSDGPYVALNNTSAMNNQGTELDDQNFMADVDLNSYWEIDVNGTDTVTTTGEQVRLICTLAGYINPANGLNLESPLNVNPTGYNNGLPDMQTTLVINPQNAPAQQYMAPALQAQKKGLFG